MSPDLAFILTLVLRMAITAAFVVSASVITERPCTVYRLSHESLERMSVEHPDLALAFHRYVICLLGERLTSSSKILRGVIE